MKNRLTSINKFLLLFFLINSILYSCKQDSTINESFVYNIPINKEDRVSSTMKYSDIFKSIEYIPLETNVESLIGIPIKIAYNENLFFILDGTTHDIVIFKKNGDYAGRISHKKGNFKATDFTIQSDSVILLRDIKNYKILRFSTKEPFNLISTEDFPFYFNEICSIDDSLFALYKSYDFNIEDSDKIFNLVIINSKNNTIFKGMKYDSSKLNKNDIIGPEYAMTATYNKRIILSEPFDYKVYLVNSNGVLPFINFNITGSMALPKDFLSNENFINKKINYVSSNPSKILGVSNIHINKDSLIVYNLQSMNSSETFITDLKTMRSFKLSSMISDSAFNYLPITERFIYANNGDSFLGLISGRLITDILIKTDNINNPILQNIKEKTNSLSNPVITIIK